MPEAIRHRASVSDCANVRKRGCWRLADSWLQRLSVSFPEVGFGHWVRFGPRFVVDLSVTELSARNGPPRTSALYSAKWPSGSSPFARAYRLLSFGAKNVPFQFLAHC